MDYEDTSYTANKRLEVGKKYHVTIDWGTGDIEFTAVFKGFPISNDGVPDYYYTKWDNGVEIGYENMLSASEVEE